MNPWGTSADDGDDDSGAIYAAPYRVSLGGAKSFVVRNRLHETSGLCLDTGAYSSVQLAHKIHKLTQLKTTALERVRELEQVEAQIATAGTMLPRQLEVRVEAVQSLRGDLEELLAMKNVLLRTLQKNVASEYLDLEMQHQRTFIDLFLKLSDELPRLATPAVATSTTKINMPHELRQRHKEYEAAVGQCKVTIARFHLIRDDMARVRAAYNQLYQSTVKTDNMPEFAGS